MPTPADGSVTDGGVRLLPASGDWPARVWAELAATDWDARPVVDVVHYAPATSTGLERVTRPLFERLDG